MASKSKKNNKELTKEELEIMEKLISEGSYNKPVRESRNGLGIPFTENGRAPKPGKPVHFVTSDNSEFDPSTIPLPPRPGERLQADGTLKNQESIAAPSGDVQADLASQYGAGSSYNPNIPPEEQGYTKVAAFDQSGGVDVNTGVLGGNLSGAPVPQAQPQPQQNIQAPIMPESQVQPNVTGMPGMPTQQAPQQPVMNPIAVKLLQSGLANDEADAIKLAEYAGKVQSGEMSPLDAGKEIGLVRAMSLYSKAGELGLTPEDFATSGQGGQPINDPLSTLQGALGGANLGGAIQAGFQPYEAPEHDYSALNNDEKWNAIGAAGAAMIRNKGGFLDQWADGLTALQEREALNYKERVNTSRYMNEDQARKANNAIAALNQVEQMDMNRQKFGQQKLEAELMNKYRDKVFDRDSANADRNFNFREREFAYRQDQDQIKNRLDAARIAKMGSKSSSNNAYAGVYTTPKGEEIPYKTASERLAYVKHYEGKDAKLPDNELTRMGYGAKVEPKDRKKVYDDTVTKLGYDPDKWRPGQQNETLIDVNRKQNNIVDYVIESGDETFDIIDTASEMITGTTPLSQDKKDIATREFEEINEQSVAEELRLNAGQQTEGDAIRGKKSKVNQASPFESKVAAFSLNEVRSGYNSHASKAIREADETGLEFNSSVVEKIMIKNIKKENHHIPPEVFDNAIKSGVSRSELIKQYEGANYLAGVISKIEGSKAISNKRKKYLTNTIMKEGAEMYPVFMGNRKKK